MLEDNLIYFIDKVKLKQILYNNNVTWRAPPLETPLPRLIPTQTQPLLKYTLCGDARATWNKPEINGIPDTRIPSVRYGA